jgi:hypothetical protein
MFRRNIWHPSSEANNNNKRLSWIRCQEWLFFTLVSSLPNSSTLKMKATYSSVTFVDFQRTTRCYVITTPVKTHDSSLLIELQKLHEISAQFTPLCYRSGNWLLYIYSIILGRNRVGRPLPITSRPKEIHFPKTFCFLVIWNSGRWIKSINPVILNDSWCSS